LLSRENIHWRDGCFIMILWKLFHGNFNTDYSIDTVYCLMAGSWTFSIKEKYVAKNGERFELDL
jgi:hypothetical protein